MLYVFKELIPIKQKIDSMVKVIPKTIKQLRGFLQLTRYSIRFIENYASIVLALTELWKEDAFMRDEDSQVAFDKLKIAMTHVRALAIPNFSRPFFF